MKAHVICCNDSIEYVVLDDEPLAIGKMLELKNAYFERNKWAFNGDQEAYNRRCYWHIHTVGYEAGAARKEGV